MNTQNLYIVDNSSEEKTVKTYLSEWCQISKQMDIATGYLEIGSFLSLDTQWQKLDKIRIILGNEVTSRTKNVLESYARDTVKYFQNSVDAEQEKNDFLLGIPAILEALKTGKIECRVYDSCKFHAKAYITYFRDEYKQKFIQAMNLPDGFALVGSSNFTKAGITQNIELNVQIRDDVTQLQQWFEERWNNGQDITQAILKVMEGFSREYTPYDIYLRAMFEYFKTREETISEWEQNDSVIYRTLAQYQRDGYNSLVQIANRYSGAFLCDGVGLGKTYVGLMLIERFVKKERKNVTLIVPASARESVWEINIKKYIPEILDGFYPFKIINHTDILLPKNQNLMSQIAEQAEIIIIDEAHHFRNRSSNRYRKFFELMSVGHKKKLFMLTATPINNSFLDLQHLIELFTLRQDDYFSEAPLGIHSLTGHFKKMEARLLSVSDDKKDEIDGSIFRDDLLVNQIIVQRSRAYVKKSLLNADSHRISFPTRQPPRVAGYSIRKSYGKLIDDFMDSFYRKDKNGVILPILLLAIYSPYEDAYFKGDRSKIDDMVSGRQSQVVNLIRQLMLKRFESSIAAFEETCIRIFCRLKKFLEDYREYGNTRAIDRLLLRQSDVIEYIEKYIENSTESVDDYLEDFPDYVWNTEDSFDITEFDIAAMLNDTILDIEVLSDFIKDIMKISPAEDDKIQQLISLLKNDENIKNRKVLIFTEYTATARYIFQELSKAGFENIYEFDGSTKCDRHELIQRFAPYYNDSSSKDVNDEIQILISTDVLAEGLNLQDASCLINYELHWNPVRLMQRIGRIDRRRDNAIEERMLFDHPEWKKDRDQVYFWNFLPPQELEQLLSLYRIVSKKALRISKTFGLEGKQLLTPDDDYEALKNFNTQYEGVATGEEEIALAFQDLLRENPDYEKTISQLPKKMYSGKINSDFQGVFFCFELPTLRDNGTWTDGDGKYVWYLLDIRTQKIIENPYDIWKQIKSVKSTPRHLTITQEDFYSKRKIVESYIRKTYLRAVQAPIGVNPRLIAWMQIS